MREYLGQFMEETIKKDLKKRSTTINKLKGFIGNKDKDKEKSEAKNKEA